MIRRLIGSYHKIRNFPRDIFRLLTDISDRLSETADLYALRQAPRQPEIDELKQEMIPFYADVTKTLLALHQTAITTAARVEDIARIVRHAEAAAPHTASFGQLPKDSQAYSAASAAFEPADVVRLEALLNRVLIALETQAVRL